MIVYGVALAAVGAAVAVTLTLRAWRDVPDAPAESVGPTLVMAALPGSAVVLALAAMLLAGERADLALPATLVGVAGCFQAVVQGILARAEVPRVAADPSRLGRALLGLALPEVVTVLALAWFFLQSSAGATSA